MKSAYHSVYKLKYHLVLVTKYRKKCLTKQILDSLESIFERLAQRWEITIEAFSAEEDHVHMLLDLHPNITPSKLVNNLKTVSSRLIRKEFGNHLASFYQKPVFWTNAYCLITAGGAPLDIIKTYIEKQNRP